MKIALVHDHLFQLGGAELVLQELSNMFPSAPVYTLIKKGSEDFKLSTTDIRTSAIQRLPGGISKFKWYLPLMPLVWENFDFSPYEVVISSASAFAKGIITQPGTIHVCYCHTPTRYLWSDRIEYLEQLRISHPFKLHLMSLVSRLRQWDFLAAARVDQFIANSNFVANRIKKFYRRESTVIYPPVPIASFTVSAEHDKFFLVVSRLRPYKRIDIAINAFNHLRLPLVVIGGGEEFNKLKKLARPNIRFLGETSDKQRNYYLSRCRALIHPQEEDFGISAIEAMASGRPVIAYQSGGALETVQEGISGSFFSEQSWEALAYAVLHHAGGEYNPAVIREYSQQFDTAVFRAQILNLIYRICEDSHAPRN